MPRAVPLRPQSGGSRVNFVPTHYWQDDNVDGVIDSFAVKAADGLSYAPVTTAAISTFKYACACLLRLLMLLCWVCAALC